MCHVINTGYNLYFKTARNNGENYLIGVKRLTIFKRDESYEAYSYYGFNKYEIRRKNTNYIFTMEKKPTVRKQQLNFILQTDENRTTHSSITIRAGMHISPFKKGHDIECRYEGKTDDDYFIIILVAFKPEEITFFDSCDVSVKKFYVLNPKRTETPYQDLYQNLDITYDIIEQAYISGYAKKKS